MSAIKRGRGRPRKGLEQTTTYVFYDCNIEQKEFVGDVHFPSPSIIKLSDPQVSPSEWVSMVTPVQICHSSGCEKEHFHCPLCPVSIMKFEEEGELQTHFTKIHTNQYFMYSDHAIVLCNLGCMDSYVSHYHCPKCGAKIGRSLHMRSHLNRCTAEPSTVSLAEESTEKRQRQSSRRRPKVSFNDSNVDNLWETGCVALDNVKATQTDANATCSKEQIDDENMKMDNKDLNSKIQTCDFENGLPEDNLVTPLDTRMQTDHSVRNSATDSGSLAGSEMISLSDEACNAKCVEANEEMKTPEVSVGAMRRETEYERDMLQVLECPHISIVRKLEDLDCRRCRTCCKLFHCPLCPRELYRSQPPQVLYNHLHQHFTRGVYYRGWTSMKCNLACGCESNEELVKAHWHCPLCPQRKLHRSRLREHLDHHQHGRTRCCRGKADRNVMTEINMNVGHNEGKLSADGPSSVDGLKDNDDVDLINANRDETSFAEEGVTNDPSDGEHTGALEHADRNSQTAEAIHISVSQLGHHNSFSVEPGDQSEVSACEDLCDPVSAVTQDAAMKETATSLTVLGSLTNSLSSGQDKSEIHILYINDLFNEAGISPIEPEEGSHVAERGLGRLECQTSPNSSEVTRGNGNVLSGVDDCVVIRGDGTMRVDDDVMVGGEEATLIKDNGQLAVNSEDMIITGDANVVNGDDSYMKEEEAQNEPSAGVLTEEGNNAVSADEQQGVTAEKNSPEVFQVITGVLMPDLVQRLAPVLDAFLMRLQDVTGITVVHEKSDGYLLQGSWTQIYGSHIILEMISQIEESAAIDIDSVFGKARADHPDLFAKSMGINGQDPRFATSGDEGENSDENEGTFRISSNEPCPYCMKRFRYKVSLFCHIIYRHDISKKPKINCDKWRTALQRMSEVTEPQCPSCGRRFTKVIHAQTHYSTNVCMSTRTNMYASLRDPVTGMYRCEHCNYSAVTPSVLMQHITYKHMKKTFPCTRCNKMFATAHILQNHLKNVHIPDVLCSVCGLHVKRRHLVSHMRGHHLRNKQVLPSIKCSHCDYYTNMPQLLERHTQREHHLDAKTCTDCGKHFQVMFDLYKHKQLEHGVSMMKFLSMYGNCPVCKKHMLKRNIHIHIRLKHYNDRRYKCTICNKMFQTKYVLDMHRETHLPSSERCYRYICQQCNMGFMTKTTYIDHIGTHNSGQLYKCSVCESSFKQKNAYRRHLQTHRENIYPCSICQEVYNSKDSLDEHVKSHEANHEAKAQSSFMFVCLCGQAFGDMSDLQEHTKDCVIMHQDMDAVENDSKADLVDQDHKGETLILIQPDSEFASEGSMLSTSQPEMFVLKTDDGKLSNSLTDAVREDIRDIQNMNIQQLDVVEDGVSLMDPDQLNMPILTSTVDHCHVQEQDGFLCGYCSTLFVNFDDVQKHILLEHGDKLPK